MSSSRGNEKMKRLLSVLLVVFCIGLVSATTTLSEYSVVLEDEQPTVIPGFVANANCWGDFNNTINLVGWHFLRVQGNPEAGTDADMAFACGYLEGYVTQTHIWDHWRNYNATHFNDVDPPQYNFMVNYTNYNWKWMKDMAASNPYTASNSVFTGFWAHIGLAMRQFEGIVQGYNDAAPLSEKMTFSEIFFLQMDEDLATIADRFPDSNTTKPAEPSAQPTARSRNIYGQGEGHCVGLIRLTNGDGSNGVLAAHNTWATYTAMLRVYKVHTLPFRSVPTESKSVAFSSAPGWMASLDDYYVASKGLVVMETTLDIFNTEIENNLIPETGTFTWIRVLAANRMARNAEHWTQIFSVSNSGTYANQWILMNKLEFGVPVPLGSLWICESVPGLTISGDVTPDLLRDGYFITNDIPYYDAILARVGGERDHFAAYFISQELLPQTNDFEAMMKLITRNNYKRDLESDNDPCEAIAKRCDLETNPQDFQLFGAVDAKVTDLTLLEYDPIYSVIYAGPPFSLDPADNIPVFTWDSVAFMNTSWVRYGIPSRFNFDYVLAPEELDVDL